MVQYGDLDGKIDEAKDEELRYVALCAGRNEAECAVELARRYKWIALLAIWLDKETTATAPLKVEHTKKVVIRRVEVLKMRNGEVAFPDLAAKTTPKVEQSAQRVSVKLRVAAEGSFMDSRVFDSWKREPITRFRSWVMKTMPNELQRAVVDAWTSTRRTESKAQGWSASSG